jgi:hypothetical protein
MNLIALLLLLNQTPPSNTASGPLRQVTVHGFRSPSIGVEVREGFLGFHVGLFPLIVDGTPEGGSRTTWFVKMGATAYFLRFDLGSGRPSSLFTSVSLMQGLNNEWDVSRSVTHGSGVHGELGILWAAWRGLDVRLGVGALLGFDGRLNVHPTPGLSWSTVF